MSTIDSDLNDIKLQHYYYEIIFQLVRKCRNGYRIRKEYRQMSTRDRDAFHRAVKLMMQTKVDNVSQYHIFVNYHRPDVSPAAHGGAAFLPFHREYLYR